MAAELPSFKRGDDLSIPCLEEADGTPVDLTGYTLRAQLRRRSDGELAAEMTVTLADQTTDPGAFTLSVPKATTVLWTPGAVLEFDVEYTTPGGFTWSSGTGAFQVEKDVTR